MTPNRSRGEAGFGVAAGCCAGIDQIVFTIPDGVQGCYVPLVVKNGNNVSNYTSIAVSQNGGACSDPFGYTSSELSTAANTGKLNVGSVSLSKVSIKITAAGFTLDNTTEVGSASFVSYAEHLHALGNLLVATEVMMLVALIIHVSTAVVLFFQNRAARPVKYAVDKTGGNKQQAAKDCFHGLS